MSFYNIWEQETNVIIITTRKIRVGLRKIFDNNVILRRTDKKYFFGFDYINYENFYIPISDLEKTLIDLIYFKEYLSKEILSRIKKKIDKNKLKNYLEKYPLRFRKIVINLIT